MKNESVELKMIADGYQCSIQVDRDVFRDEKRLQEFIAKAILSMKEGLEEAMGSKL